MSLLTPTVFLVDDDEPVLRALSRLLRLEGWRVMTFNQPRDFLSHSLEDVAGCLVLDVTMPGLNGLELQKALVRGDCRLPIIFLTGTGDIPMAVQAIKAGAVEFLSKPCQPARLVEAVRQAMARNQEDRQARARESAMNTRLDSLTPREREVMGGVVNGQLNKQIASDLGISVKTVKIHRARVMEKVAVRSVADLVRLAERMPAAKRSPVRNSQS